MRLKLLDEGFAHRPPGAGLVLGIGRGLLAGASGQDQTAIDFERVLRASASV
jgi:hypothetical protein